MMKNNSQQVEILEHPFANLSKSERKKVIDEVQRDAVQNYDNALSELQSLLKEYNPIVVLSQLSNYALLGGIGDEVVNEGSRSISQAHIEICQALILKIDPEKFNLKTPLPEIIQKIIDSLKSLLESNLYKNWNSNISSLSEKDINIRYFKDYIISHTQNVRNWGNFRQVNNISSELYAEFDDKLIKEYGFNSSQVIRFFNYLVKDIEKESTDMFRVFKEIRQSSDIKSMIQSYHAFVDVEKSETEGLLQYFKKHNITDKEDVFINFIYSYHSDQFLPKTFTFNYKAIAKEIDLSEEVVEGILNKFTYSLGDLRECKTEHLFLGNPVWTKPLIMISEEEFFSPMPQLFFSFILRAFDNLIESIDNNKLSDTKAKYLENKIEKIVKTRFSEAIIKSSFKWEEYENDLVVFIDTYIIIFEAKSGKITDSALRGSPDRLKKKVKELLVEPNIQSKRLKDKLIYLINNPDIKDKIRNKLPIILTENHRILRVSVQLEYFASLQSNITSLKKTGWIPNDFTPCPSMNIGAFETIFDILEHPIQIINYLEMREEIEEKVKYHGDELDLLVTYINNRFNFINTDSAMQMIAGTSKSIDDYYQLIDAGMKANKPKMKMNSFFEKILIQLEDRKPHGWILMGSVIYRLLPKDQQGIVDMLDELKESVAKNWAKGGHENIIIYRPPLLSEYAFCFVYFNNKNKEKRYDFFNEAILTALEPNHVEYCLAIAKNIDMNDISYSMIAISNKNDNISILLEKAK